jgi:iron(III) transport system permease protein
MLLALVILISLENYSRRRQKLYQGSGSTHTELRFVLQGWRKWGVLTFSWGLLFFAFILPLAVLFYYASLYFSQSFNLSLWKYTLNSVWLATIVASLSLLIALIVNFYQRLSPGVSARLCAAGYRGCDRSAYSLDQFRFVVQ